MKNINKEIILKYLVSGIMIDKNSMLGGFRGFGKSLINTSSSASPSLKPENIPHKL